MIRKNPDIFTVLTITVFLMLFSCSLWPWIDLFIFYEAGAIGCWPPRRLGFAEIAWPSFSEPTRPQSSRQLDPQVVDNKLK